VLRVSTVDSELVGKTARIALNRPEALNCVSPATVRDLSSALTAAADDRDVNIIVITGRGRAFCSGVDLSELSRDAITADDFVAWEAVLSLCEEVPKPVICGIHGYCLGAGLQLALACDVRVSATDAIFGMTAVQECLVPALGVWRLPRYVGMGAAKRMVLACERLDAKQALALAMVDYVVEPAQLEAQLSELVSRFDGMARTSFKHSKRLLNHAFDFDHAQALSSFLEAEMDCLQSPEHAEASAAWREKRAPRYA